MSTESTHIRARVENAANVLGRCWPLQSFIAANPLAGLEGRSFHDAVMEARRLFGARAYPGASDLGQALERAAIDPGRLEERLEARGWRGLPEELLERMRGMERVDQPPASPREGELDRIMSTWLAAFLDQGQAVWPMPHRDRGFYGAWRAVALHDTRIPNRKVLRALPEDPVDAVAQALGDEPEARWEAIFRHHLVAMPGWAAFIAWRSQSRRDPWQLAHPISLLGYLAARLQTASALGLELLPAGSGSLSSGSEGSTTGSKGEDGTLAAAWLEAWEMTYRDQLLSELTAAVPADEAPSETFDAQLVFCIDVRSEVFRRHLEAEGPWETLGYAGFFGLPIRVHAHGAPAPVESCPPIVAPRHRIPEVPAAAHAAGASAHGRWTAWTDLTKRLQKSLKSNISGAFGFVEGVGSVFGAGLAARTLMPRALRDGRDVLERRVPQPESFCVPELAWRPEEDGSDGLPVGLTTDQRVLYAEAAFRLMGWGDFSPVVVFVGHGCETVNNPYKSSLDCGACAGHPGGPNARILAAICNDPEVQSALRARGVGVPEGTAFFAAEHNTTTDEVRIFPGPPTTDVQARILVRLKEALQAARVGASTERVRSLPGASAHSGSDTRRRASDWAEVRPEWGLAGNASFIIGHRRLTATLDLQGRAFLHSHDWRTDPDGALLEVIMTGPLVVGEWINTQYYFSSVDNAVYGSGSKITHNVVGNFGIWQGNGGDLMTGLPLQSLRTADLTPRHDPLRLLAVVHAPVARVERILRRNANLAELFDHEWMALAVLDPEQDNEVFRYQPGGAWTGQPASGPPRTSPLPTP